MIIESVCCKQVRKLLLLIFFSNFYLTRQTALVKNLCPSHYSCMEFLMKLPMSYYYYYYPTEAMLQTRKTIHCLCPYHSIKGHQDW